MTALELRQRLTIILLGALVSSCAEVEVRKVPTPSQYVEWTDEMQRRADKMVGFRFYLPRPFVTVHESFPVSTDIYLADGMVSPDGKYVLITNVRGGSALKEYIASELVEGRTVSSAYIRKTTPETINKLVSPQGGDEVEESGDRVSTGVEDSGQTSVPATRLETTGLAERKVTNDNSAFAYQPTRGAFDVAYLPDMDEQYVVNNTAGLGTAKFELNLGQGWSLQGFDSISDNSALNKRIYDLIDTSISAAKTAAGTALGFPVAPSLPPEVEEIVKPQAGAEDEMIPGSPVTLKIVVVHYAAKGLYPVIKPRELQERKESEDGKYYMTWDLFRLIPRATPASNFDFEAIEAAREAISRETGRFTIPRYPYQYVSFNTFRYMAIETLTPAGAPFGSLYHPTGISTASPQPKSSLAGLGGRREGNVPANEHLENSVLERLVSILEGGSIRGDTRDGHSFEVTGSRISPDGSYVDVFVERSSTKINQEEVRSVLLQHPVIASYQNNLDPRQLKITFVDEKSDTSATNPERSINDKLPTGAAGLSRDQIELVQKALCLSGNDVDGLWGPVSQRALRSYQQEMQMSDTAGVLDSEVAIRLISQPASMVSDRCYPTTETDLSAMVAVLKGQRFSLGDSEFQVARVVTDSDRGVLMVELSAPAGARATSADLKQALVSMASALGIALASEDVEFFRTEP
ncbi:MAG: hypothetical protein AAF662_04935 [Pseudomonadota bacterium]